MALFTVFEVKLFDSNSLTAAYQAFGSALEYPCYECVICNESNVPVEISKDGTNQILRVGAGKTHFYKGRTRETTSDKALFLFSKSTQLYIANKVTGSGFITCNVLMAR